jgi:hypothetical protein
MKIKTLLIAILISSMQLFAQSFDIKVEPVSFPNLVGTQSFAFAQADGKWLIIGGRKDGLHLRQPFSSFDIAGQNNLLRVIDVANQQQWTAPLTSLSVGLQNQLSSTNMEFYQEGNTLYLLGGYGYSSTTTTRITYDKLTAIDVAEVIDAVINNTTLVPYFRQITDAQFAVTGGHLNKIYDTYYLVGGQKFDGNYNPMGNPTYTQVYTNAIRKFQLIDDGVNITINHLPTITDAANLHRRDYNVMPQILPNGEQGLTAFSGVFQTTADIPFLNCVNIDSSGYAVNNTFAQYYNHYHCANVPIYSESMNEMHAIFLGGIAQYYDNNGTLVQDNNVPFVKTIARVTRDASGTMTEYKFTAEMPGYLGSSSEFIQNDNLVGFENGVLKLDSLTNDTTLLGYIYGGINSTAANIFFSNTGTQSSASTVIYKVLLIKNTATNNSSINKQSTNGLQLQLFPNPNNGIFSVSFFNNNNKKVRLTVRDNAGKVVYQSKLNNLQLGKNIVKIDMQNETANAIYIVTLETENQKATQKIIIHKD